MSYSHRKIAVITFLSFIFNLLCPLVFFSSIYAQSQQLEPDSDVDTVVTDSIDADLIKADSLRDTIIVETEPDTVAHLELEELPKKKFRHSLKAEVIAGIAVVVWLFFMFWAANMRE